jgi:hypothetical protein
VVSGTEKKMSSFLPWMSYKGSGLTALIPETDCDQTALSLPPVTSAVFLEVILVNRERLGEISGMHLLLLWE